MPSPAAVLRGVGLRLGAEQGGGFGEGVEQGLEQHAAAQGTRKFGAPAYFVYG